MACEMEIRVVVKDEDINSLKFFDCVYGSLGTKAESSHLRRNSHTSTFLGKIVAARISVVILKTYFQSKSTTIWLK